MTPQIQELMRGVQYRLHFITENAVPMTPKDLERIDSAYRELFSALSAPIIQASDSDDA